MRKSEALGLKWSNIDFNNRAINVKDTLVFTDEGMVEQLNDTKTESSKRTIPILDKLNFYLKKHKLSQAELKLKVGQVYVDERYVFASYTGKPYHDRNIRRALNRITRNAGLGHFTPHTLRHTFGTRLMESGVQPTVIRDLLGHSDIRTTLQIYTHTTEDSKEKAIEIMAKSLQI